MSLVNIVNVTVLNNPTHFTSSFQFQIQFECLQDLPEDLDWKLTYVGNAESDEGDQVLEEISVGPNVPGVHMFVLQTPGPNPTLIKNQDLIGVTVILLTCSYLDQVFVRIGYYVSNEYMEPFEPENYPNPVNIALLHRVVLADQPRITRSAIDWTGQSPLAPPIEANGSEELAAIAASEADNGEDDSMDADDDEDEDDDEDDEEVDANAVIDLEEEDEEADMEARSGEEGSSDELDAMVTTEVPQAQYFINEDSMDVQSMQIEHPTHSHSYSSHFRDYM